MKRFAALVCVSLAVGLAGCGTNEKGEFTLGGKTQEELAPVVREGGNLLLPAVGGAGALGVLGVVFGVAKMFHNKKEDSDGN